MFITFEGPEGSGKSTQIRWLAERLRSLGREIVVTREPGGTPGAERIRDLALSEPYCPEAELLLFLAARAEHVTTRIQPALARGAVVLCDRFTHSTLAYQGHGLGLDLPRLRDLCAFAARGVVPDLTLLLDVLPELGLARRRAAVGADSQAWNQMEDRDLEFHHRVRLGFLKEAEREPERVCRIEGARTADEVRQAVWEAVAVRCSLAGGGER